MSIVNNSTTNLDYNYIIDHIVWNFRNEYPVVNLTIENDVADHNTIITGIYGPLKREVVTKRTLTTRLWLHILVVNYISLTGRKLKM